MQKPDHLEIILVQELKANFNKPSSKKLNFQDSVAGKLSKNFVIAFNIYLAKTEKNPGQFRLGLQITNLESNENL